ncbi:Plasma kallikrein [Orchesella cincta]|uniref:Plasma kallikrein n=1 Tax=Orchesella cincta TaxID=48709 RepID=A0A1D2N319_ORCCI|nr:Plasma kallikrein [Orchesella cincta]
MNKIILIYILISGISLEINGDESSDFPFEAIPRVINGRKAGWGEFPFQIGLYNHQGFSCGGSIITVNGKQLILTAAHCIDKKLDPRFYHVTAGNLFRNTKESTQQWRQVVKFAVHKDYNKDKGHINDIALLRLHKPFAVNYYVSPVSLPPRGEKIGITAVVSGWGITNVIDPTSNALLTATITVWPDSICSAAVPFYDPSAMLCAGSYRGSCKGDSGGPLLDKKTNQLAGVVSYGVEFCTKPNKPGFYVRVSSYIDWIEEQARDL